MRSAVAGVAFLALGLLGVMPATGQEVRFKLIVHSSNPISSMSRDQVEKIFLKKVERWQDGARIAPVDQPASSAVRESFCAVVLNREVAWIQSYWQRQLFSGRDTPPPELGSDREVADYVGTNNHAIGYVSATVTLGSEIKVVKITE